MSSLRPGLGLGSGSGLCFPGSDLTSDSTSRMVSPADGSSFQPTTWTAVLGPASFIACSFSSNRERTLAHDFPATRTQPRFRTPRWMMAVAMGLRRNQNRFYDLISFRPPEPILMVLLGPSTGTCSVGGLRPREDSPFAFTGSALNDQPLHRTSGVRLQLQNLSKCHRGLNQRQQVVALATGTSLITSSLTCRVHRLTAAINKVLLGQGSVILGHLRSEV